MVGEEAVEIGPAHLRHVVCGCGGDLVGAGRRRRCVARPQLAQAESNVTIQRGEDLRVEIGHSASVEFLIEQFEPPHHPGDAANEQALGETRLDANLRKQLALASPQEAPRPRGPMDRVADDAAGESPAVGAVTRLLGRWCRRGSHAVLYARTATPGKAILCVELDVVGRRRTKRLKFQCAQRKPTPPKELASGGARPGSGEGVKDGLERVHPG